MSRRPHPAPMRRQRRSPVLLSAARPLPDTALTGPWLIVARSQGARHAAPPSLPRAAARSHRAPSPEYRPAAARTHWARLVRIAPTACRRPHRIYPTACRHPHPPMSPPSRFRAHRPPSRPSCAAAVLHVLRFAVRIAPTVRRHPRHPPHLSPRVASAPGPWLARIAPHASLFRRMREKGPLPGNIRPKCMLFEIKMATSSPHASISGRNRAIRDTWRANLAAKALFRVEEPEIMHGAKMLPAPPGLSAAAACSPAERALRPAARAWPACRMRPPAISPAFIAAVLHAPRFAVRDPPRGPRTDASRYLRAAPIPPAARTHRVQETSGTTQATQCEHKNRIPKWGPY